MKNIAACLITLVLCACSNAGGSSYQSYLERKNVRVSSTNSFEHCSGYGCTKKIAVKPEKKMWTEIDQIFKPAAKSPQEERRKIALAIGVFEQHVGKLTNTDTDKKGTFVLGEGQLDCVDESINTTVYLSLLGRRNLLKFHDLHAPTVRLPLFDRDVSWPHQTALISEKASGNFYVVDSWFHDNGERAEIMPLDEWRAGWRPENKVIAMK